ncbi:uncharacterized protein LOC129893880 [Solanum dulcamara]|uniref:uncharacterized protein LOC129893880 n=1 Tax=Solanum dulcamara TaxID=45834 RepID=UPI0024866E5F|nr:uncharacterized protein LOC129893880 [Solanum dulcamara]
MEKSDEQKSAVIKRFIDTKVNVGRKEIFDTFRARSRTAVVEKEACGASSMLLMNNATTNLTHGFINSLQPCLLASSRPLSIMGSTPLATCRRHGFSSHLSLGEIERSEYYTRVEIRSPRYRVVHRYMDCELEFKEDQSHRANFLGRAEQEKHQHLLGYKDRFLPRPVRKCKMCNKTLEHEDIFMHGEYRFCSSECRSNDTVPYVEQRMAAKYNIRRSHGRRTRRNGRVEFYTGGIPAD